MEMFTHLLYKYLLFWGFFRFFFSAQSPVLDVNEKALGTEVMALLCQCTVICKWLFSLCWASGEHQKSVQTFLRRECSNTSPGCSLWKMLLRETGQISKTHTQKRRSRQELSLCRMAQSHHSLQGVKWWNFIHILAYADRVFQCLHNQNRSKDH